MKVLIIFFCAVNAVSLPACYAQTNHKCIDKDGSIITPGTKLSCIQGIFSPIDDENPNLKTYWINKGFKTLTVVIKQENCVQDIYSFSTGYNGFYDFEEYTNNFSSYSVVDSFYVCNLRDDAPIT